MSNELIARDEGLHTKFACLLARHLWRMPLFDIVRTMLTEAVDLEAAFFEGMFAVHSLSSKSQNTLQPRYLALSTG